MNPLMLFVVLAAACYNPTPARYRCIDNSPGSCPDGVSCIQGWCGGPPSGMEMGVGMMDAGGRDLNGIFDAATMADFGPTAAAGCASGLGYPLGGNLYACPGLFGPGQLRQRCAPGYGLPRAVPLSAAACQSITSGFFVADSFGAENKAPPPGASLNCAWTGYPQGAQRYVFGCGQGSGVYKAAQPCASEYANNCDPLDGTGGSATRWICRLSSTPKDSDFENIMSTNPADGVLCWKP